MGLELLEYQVFRANSVLQTPGGNEIDATQVPAGQTWRLEHLAIALFFPPGALFYPIGNQTLIVPPIAGVYDVTQPGPTVVPAQMTQLAPLAENNGINGNFTPGNSVGNSWYDADDDPGITLGPGNQLAVLFYTNQTGGPSGICAIRAQFAVFQGTAGQPQPAAGIGTPGPAIPVGI